MSAPARLCIYAPHLYPVLGRGRVRFAGGGEVQLWLVARALAARGLAVDVVTCDYGQPAEETVEGVRLLRAWRSDAGLPGLRFFHPRLTSAVAALHRSAADVYLVKGAGLNAGLAFDVARSRRRAFVFVAGHELDVEAALPRVHGPRDRWWARRALRGADAVVAQTERQRERFREGFGRDATVITNAVELPAQPADAGANDTVLWVATYKPSKRPDWFLRLAERNPHLRCVMAGVVPPPPLDEREYRRALEAASRLPNLEVGGPVAHDRVGELYRRAALFAHTSPAEGFPNTFLEAWSHAVPAVTAFDPDGILARQRLGERHDGYEAWEEAVLRWMRDAALRREAGVRAREYVRTAHGPETIAARWGDLLGRLAVAGRGRS